MVYYGSLIFFFFLQYNQFRCFVMSSQQTSGHIYCCLPADNDTGVHVFLFLPPVFVRLSYNIDHLKGKLLFSLS